VFRAIKRPRIAENTGHHGKKNLGGEEERCEATEQKKCQKKKCRKRDVETRA